MVLARTTHTVSDASDITYSIGFQWLQESDVLVYLDSGGGPSLVSPLDYSIDRDTNVATLSGVTLNVGDKVIFQRDTAEELTAQLAQFTAGAGLSEAAMDALQEQLLYQIQEMHDAVWDTAFGSESLVDHLENGAIHLPDGGNAGDILEKASSGDGDVQWTPTIRYAVPATPDGSLLTFDASGNPIILAPSDAGKVLVTNGAGAAPSWQTVSGVSGKFVGFRNGAAQVVNPTGSSSGDPILWTPQTGLQASSGGSDFRFGPGPSEPQEHIQFLNAGTYLITVAASVYWSSPPTDFEQEETIRLTALKSTDDITYSAVPGGGAMLFNLPRYDSGGPDATQRYLVDANADLTADSNATQTKDDWSNLARCGQGCFSFLYTAAAGDYLQVRIGRFSADSGVGQVSTLPQTSSITIVEV